MFIFILFFRNQTNGIIGQIFAGIKNFPQILFVFIKSLIIDVALFLTVISGIF